MVNYLSFSEDDKLNPVAQLRPSMYDIQAAGPVEYLKIDKHLLVEFSRSLEADSDDISVEELDGDQETCALTFTLYQDLQNDKISLPSLPQVAQRIQQVF